MPFVAAICSQCGAKIQVDPLGSTVCEFCGTPFVMDSAVSPGNAGALMKRGLLFLEDGDWPNANAYFEKVLDSAPEHAPAYVGKLCAQYKVRREQDLGLCGQPIQSSGNFQKALRFADAELRQRLTAYGATTEKRLQKLREEKERKEAEERERRLELERRVQEGERLKQERLAEEAAQRARKQEKKNRRLAIIASAVALGLLAAALIFVAVENYVTIPNNYSSAVALFEEGKFREAYDKFSAWSDYEDSRDYMQQCVTPVRESLRHGTIAAGSYHSAALREDGTVVMAGSGMADYRSEVEGWKDIVMLDTLDNDLAALDSNGEVFVAGEDYEEYKKYYYLTQVKDVQSITLASAMLYGLKEDGTIIATGLGSTSARLDEVFGWKNVTSIAASSLHTVALKADGTAVGFDDSGFNKPTPDKKIQLEEWTDLVQVAAGTNKTVGLRADGTVLMAGNTISGTQNWKDIVAVDVAWEHVVGLTAGGRVIAAGNNEYGQCDTSEWRDIVAVAAGDYHTVGLKADGTVVATGRNGMNQCNVSAWTDIAR